MRLHNTCRGSSVNINTYYHCGKLCMHCSDLESLQTTPSIGARSRLTMLKVRREHQSQSSAAPNSCNARKFRIEIPERTPTLITPATLRSPFIFSLGRQESRTLKEHRWDVEGCPSPRAAAADSVPIAANSPSTPQECFRTSTPLAQLLPTTPLECPPIPREKADSLSAQGTTLRSLKMHSLI